MRIYLFISKGLSQVLTEDFMKEKVYIPIKVMRARKGGAALQTAAATTVINYTPLFYYKDAQAFRTD